MNNLQSSNNLAVTEQIKSEIRVTGEGKGFSSVRGVARLSSVDESSLREAFQSAGQKPSKLAQFLASEGFELRGIAEWLETGVPDIAVESIVYYYAFKAGRHCKAGAKDVHRVLSKVGTRQWMRALCGWQSESDRELELARLEAEKAKHEAQIIKDKILLQSTGLAIVQSMGTEAGIATLAYLRGDAPPPPLESKNDIVFVEQGTDRVVGSAKSGQSFTALLQKAGMNPKSKQHQAQARNVLKALGVDWESKKGVEIAQYVREYPVLPDVVFDAAVVSLRQYTAEQNLFVNHYQTSIQLKA